MLVFLARHRPFLAFVAVLAWVCTAFPVSAGVVINEIHFAPAEKRPLEFVELHNFGDEPVALDGWTLAKFTFPKETTLPAGGYLVVATHPEELRKEFRVPALGPLPGKLSNEGEKVTLRDSTGKVADSVRYGVGFPWPSATLGLGSSIERLHPLADGTVPGHWRASGFKAQGGGGQVRPTPGARNSVTTDSMPPVVHTVTHSPDQPLQGNSVTVTAKVTDAQSVRSVVLLVQDIAPGNYLRKKDSEYEKRWTEVLMRDDGTGGDTQGGDGVFTAVLSGKLQKHRHLVRYRVRAMNSRGATTQVPYPDDPSPNFAYYVSNGPCEYVGAFEPGKTPILRFSTDFQNTLTTFTLIAREKDVQRSQYDGNYNHQPQSGTFVFNGTVHDHIAFHNRGTGSVYLTGKNKWKFQFPETHELAMTNRWGIPKRRKWNSFSMDACASPWVPINRGMAGLDGAIPFHCYQLVGVPAPDALPVAFRVVTNAVESTNQYASDAWGLYLAIEDPDGPWLKNHDWPPGITYKPEDGVKHVPSGYTGSAQQEWNRFIGGAQGDPETWWRANMDIPSYASFHAMNAYVGNVDIRPGANHVFYQHAQRGWMPVPWDLDMMFIPRSHQPGYIDQAKCLEYPGIALEYRNRAREILDLLASDSAADGGQIGQVFAAYTRKIAPGGARDWAEFDRVRWDHAPASTNKGLFCRNPCEQDMSGGRFARTLVSADFSGFVRYALDYCTDSRPEKNYAFNDGNPLGYGYGRLLRESADKDIPERPVLTDAGGGSVRVSPFSDPQGPDTFAALAWRMAEIDAPPDGPWSFEIEAPLAAVEFHEANPTWHPPVSLFPSHGRLRIRARYKDSSGRWSHWSAPMELQSSR